MNNVFMNLFAPPFDRIASKGDTKGIAAIHYFMWFVKYSLPAVLVGIGIYLGAAPVRQIIKSIPPVLMRAFNAVGGFLPAVGFAILAQMLWDKRLSIYFILGFILVEYFKLPLVAVAVLGGILIVAIGLRDKQLFDLDKKVDNSKNVDTTNSSSDKNSNDKEVEDFFDEN